MVLRDFNPSDRFWNHAADYQTAGYFHTKPRILILIKSQTLANKPACVNIPVSVPDSSKLQVFC